MSSRGSYKEGKKEGSHEQWYKSGQPCYQKNYVNGELEGLQKEWYESGQLEVQANYKAGELEGLREEFGLDGSAIRTFFKNGVRYYPDIADGPTVHEGKKKITLKPKKKGGVKI